jgi:hypothetical protein
MDAARGHRPSGTGDEESDMTTFVLVADTANGVQRVDREEFLIEKPDAEFVPAADFIDYLKDLEDGEQVQALFDDLVHAAHFDRVHAEYGVR